MINHISRTKRCLTAIFSILVSLLITIGISFSQAPAIEWENTIGGSSSDFLEAVEQTADGGYILAGFSASSVSGDKSEYVSGNDFWIIKLTNIGTIEWQNTIGGSGSEIHYYYGKFKIHQTPDGGYILGGSSNSDISFDKTQNEYNYSYDYWVLKLDNLGAIEWQKTIGGAGTEYLSSLELTSDNGYLIGGSSSSPISYDKYEASWGGFDYWVVKLNSAGEIVGEKTIGGDQDDYLVSAKETPDGGFILCGSSYSGIGGNKTEAAFVTDYWVVKLNVAGEIEWQNTIGGLGGDYIPSLVIDDDGGYTIAGYSGSGIGRDKTENAIGVADYWIVRLDDLGNIIWQHTIGGGDSDSPAALIETEDNGYLIGGTSNSGITGMKSEASHGEYDYWLVKVNALGNIIWQKTIGGYGPDNISDMDQTADGGFILGGYSTSQASFDKSENNMGSIYTQDYWVVKLAADTCFVTTEICNGLDDDCNGIIDDGYTYSTYYYDGDADGFGNDTLFILGCPDITPVGYSNINNDCDDDNETIQLPEVYYADADGDSFGDSADSIAICSFITPDGYTMDKLDCDDSNILINPVTNEICNNTDDNCNTLIDEGLPVQILYVDADNDYFGNPLVDTTTCLLAIAGYTSNNMDCNDSDSLIYPGAYELYDGVDNNCNSLIDEGTSSIEEGHTIVISISPNPATDFISINVPFAGYSYSITDISGKILMRNVSYSNLETCQVTQLLPGIYFIQVQSEGYRISGKFMKQ